MGRSSRESVSREPAKTGQLPPALLPERIVEWGSGGVHGFGWSEFGISAGVQAYVPALAVHNDMVVFAQKTQII
jgi:hypothetical protein